MEREVISYTKVLDIAKKLRDAKQGDLAKALGISGASFSSKISHGTLRINEFFKIMEYLNCEIKIFDSETGRDITECSGAGRSVKGWINNILFDTDASVAVANDFYQDGQRKYNGGMARELYKDKFGRYFFAIYSNFENDRDRIALASPVEAREFIEKYGTDTRKGPESDAMIGGDVNG